jgi:hypothetical protein
MPVDVAGAIKEEVRFVKSPLLEAAVADDEEDEGRAAALKGAVEGVDIAACSFALMAFVIATTNISLLCVRGSMSNFFASVCTSS